MGSVPGSGTSPAVENGNPLQYFCWEIPWAEEPGGLQLMESQRGRHNSVTNTFTFIQNIAISASHVSCIFLGNLEENIFGFCIDFKCYAVSSPVCYWLDTGCAFLEGLLRTGHGFLFLFFFFTPTGYQKVTLHSLDSPSVSTSVFILNNFPEGMGLCMKPDLPGFRKSPLSWNVFSGCFV